jgi:hypothetical protein
LLHAAICGRTEAVRLWLEHGANARLVNSERRSALLLAGENPFRHSPRPGGLGWRRAGKRRGDCVAGSLVLKALTHHPASE